MSDVLPFLLTVLALLATPGPTNTLLAASGAVTGFRRSLRLVPAEIAGYVTTILILVAWARPLIEAHPVLTLAVKLAASFWLILCAARLWRDAGQTIAAIPDPVSPCRVFVTTLINPKAQIFALVVLPAGPLASLGLHLGLLTACIPAVALGWISLGRVLIRSTKSRLSPRLVWRVAAAVLVVFALITAGAAIAAP